jgi:hypothetical protein
LQHAHEARLIHRDVKPANIVVERNGNVRLLDLGLARFFEDESDPLTLKYDDQNVLGTVDYVSPEQAVNSHEVDIRADIYSLGCTLYFVLTGRPPFPEGKVAQKLIWHQLRQPRPIRELQPGVPAGLAAVAERMMAKDRQQRYQTPLEVVEALAPWTAEPIAPPSEAEMPQLCPALATAGEGGPTTPRQLARAAPALSAALPAPPAAAAGGGRVLTLTPPELAPAGAAKATPPLLAAHAPTDTPTETSRPRGEAPRVRPSRLLARVREKVGAPSARPWRGALLVLLLFLVSALGGIALRWLLTTWW